MGIRAGEISIVSLAYWGRRRACLEGNRTETSALAYRGGLSVRLGDNRRDSSALALHGELSARLAVRACRDERNALINALYYLVWRRGLVGFFGVPSSAAALDGEVDAAFVSLPGPLWGVPEPLDHAFFFTHPF